MILLKLLTFLCPKCLCPKSEPFFLFKATSADANNDHFHWHMEALSYPVNTERCF